MRKRRTISRTFPCTWCGNIVIYIQQKSRKAEKRKKVRKKVSGKFGGLAENQLLCTLVCGSSCKASKNDALRGDMRTEMAATNLRLIIVIR